MRNIFCLLLVAASLFAAGENDNTTQGGEEVVVIHFLIEQGPGEAYHKMITDEFNASQDRIRVEVVNAPAGATAVYAVILQAFEAQQDTMDVLPVDTIWPGDFAEHLVDLNTLGAREIAVQMFDSLIDSNTLDGRLLALPSFNNAALLFYRKDLLQKYGYSNPPRTWDELEEMATTVQQGERAANPNFWGYVWQGDNYEGLACVLLEWTYSNGDDLWIDSNRRITINNPKTAAMLNRAKNWIGEITPPAVLSFKEEETWIAFQTGNAVFMRNWLYAYGLANEEGSPLKGLVGIAPLPAGDAGHGAATIGAWATGISRYSKHPQEAFEFVKFSLSYEKTLRRARLTGDAPPYTAAYEDEAVLNEIPAIGLLAPIFENAVARPSTITAPNYNAVSTRIVRGVYNVLSGRSETTETLEEIALDIQGVTGFEIAN